MRCKLSISDESYCCNCNEPWEAYELRECVVAEAGLKKVHNPLLPSERDALRTTGFEFGNSILVVKHCPCCGSKEYRASNGVLRKMISEELAIILGDDLDGLEAELDDAEYIGLFDAR